MGRADKEIHRGELRKGTKRLRTRDLRLPNDSSTPGRVKRIRHLVAERRAKRKIRGIELVDVDRRAAGRGRVQVYGTAAKIRSFKSDVARQFARHPGRELLHPRRLQVLVVGGDAVA